MKAFKDFKYVVRVEEVERMQRSFSFMKQGEEGRGKGGGMSVVVFMGKVLVQVREIIRRRPFQE